MSVDQLIAKIQPKMAYAANLSSKIKFDLKDDGIIFVDATQPTPVISQEDHDADLTIITTKDTLEGILNGTQDPNIAFMMGKVKVKGNMALAMKLNSILED